MGSGWEKIRAAEGNGFAGAAVIWVEMTVEDMPAVLRTDIP